MDNYFFEGLDTIELAKKYGTPLYLVSENIIVQKIREIKDDFLSKYNNTFAAYASKAFLNKEMARIVKAEGIGMDVVSGGELYTTISVDFPMENIIFHGNSKSTAELTMAVEHNVGRIVVDNLDELHKLNYIAKKFDKKVNILFRITPGVTIDTHKYIQTGQVDSKFGIPLIKDTIYGAIEEAISLENINLLGFHFHVGSQLHGTKSHLEAIGICFGIMREACNKLNFITKELNVGGGFGVKYVDSDYSRSISFFMDPIMKSIKTHCENYDLLMPKIIIEPGRWITADSGITLYTVNSTKEIPGIRTYVSVDGGMTDNPRPALYNAAYKAIVANKYGEDRTNLYTIAGKCCETGDILIWDLESPKIEPGDIIAVMGTGAYNYSMSSNYNRNPKPPVVMIKDGESRVIVKGETYQDILRNDI